MEQVSVTTVLDFFQHPKLVDWKVAVGKAKSNKISRDALRIGSIVDKYVQGDIEHGSYKVLAKDKEKVAVGNCLKAYERWKADYKPDYSRTLTQEELAEPIWGVIGHPDLMCPDKIDDVKCAKRISKSYWIQVMVYAYMARHKYGKIPPRVGILQLGKENGDYLYVQKPFDMDLVECFKGLLINYRYQEGE